MTFFFNTQTARMLHDEHQASVDLLGRIERSFMTVAPAARTDADACAPLLRALGDLRAHLDGELGRHFDFEENAVFPLLAAAGDDDIAELLRHEHAAIRDGAARLIPLAQAAQRGELDAAGWDALARAVTELVDRQLAHIQKETMGLLPMLEDLLDDERDQQLAAAYAAA
ncbi:MAG TPA: hemerythrin domain-containing protein [Burkholderiaceae bacterium]|nr:hemerythrin domain-containing protein [Burkholderiaceae bacterium]